MEEDFEKFLEREGIEQVDPKDETYDRYPENFNGEWV